MATTFEWDGTSAAWTTNHWGRTTHAISSVTEDTSGPGSGYIVVVGDVEDDFPDGGKFQIIGSTANDDTYTVASASYISGNGSTTIVVEEALLNGADDGEITICPVWPGDTNAAEADTVSITTATAPTDGPGGAVTIAELELSGSSFAATSNLTVTDELTLGTESGSDAPVFAGGTGAGATVTCYGASVFSGSASGDVTIYDTAVVSGSVGGNLTIRSSAAQTGSVTGYARVGAVSADLTGASIVAGVQLLGTYSSATVAASTTVSLADSALPDTANVLKGVLFDDGLRTGTFEGSGGIIG